MIAQRKILLYNKDVKNYFVESKTHNLRLIDIQSAITTLIEPQLSEDSLKYNLDNNNRLLRQFIVYRVATFIFSVLENNAMKNVFVLPTSISLSLYSKNEMFITNIFRKFTDLLSLNLLRDTDFSCVRMLDCTTGEGKELRNKIHGIVTSNKKNIRFNEINKFLEKYKIHKLQGEVSQNFKVKLGLFVT